MQIKCELNIEVVMNNVDSKGTGCQGYLPDNTRYKDIVKVFGKPRFGESPYGKRQAEWTGKINGLVFTIYDYKSDIPVNKNTDWHIGGKSSMTAELVNAYFKAVMNK